MATTEVVVAEQREVAGVATDSGAAFLAMLAAAARDPQVDIAKMEGLMAMQERIMAKQAEIAFNQAMARLQSKLPRITKRGKIEFTSKGVAQSTPFAKFEDVMSAIGPLLREEGFAFSFGTEPIEKGGILITSRLTHAAGHSTTASMPLPFDTSGSKNSIQAVGSSLSYGRRYLVFAMLNLVTEGEDDDANKLTFVDQDQQMSIEDMITECGMDADSRKRFLALMGVESVTEIRRSDFDKAMRNLNKKLALVRKGVA